MLTKKKLKFVEHYILTGNATESALEAGYSKKTSYSIGPRLLKDVEIQDRIQQSFNKASEELDVTTKRTLNELAIIGFSDIKEIANFDGKKVTVKSFKDLTREQTAAIQSIEVNKLGDETINIKLKQYPKIQALQTIAQHLGMMTQKVQVDHTIKEVKILQIEDVNKFNQLAQAHYKNQKDLVN